MAGKTSQDEVRELRSRGMKITARQWNAYSYKERQDILRQSRATYRKTTRAGQPEAQRVRNARRRADRYSQKTKFMRKLTWQDDEEVEYWDRYRENEGLPSRLAIRAQRGAA